MKYVLRLLLFWLLFFLFQQLIFAGANYSTYKGTLVDFLFSLLKAFPLNLASACYLVSLPLLLIIAGEFGLNPKWINPGIRYTTIIFIVICSILLCTDISLFQVWGTKTNAKALSYMQYPKELMPTVFTSQNLWLFLLIALQIFIGIKLFKKINLPFEPSTYSIPSKITFSLLLLASFVIGFRGGIQRVPINRNWVFHSAHPMLNYVALNSFWNMADLLTHPLESQGNPYVFFDDQEAKNITAGLHQTEKDSTVYILNTARPNIVIIFLESWAADVMECLGGEKGVTPKFTELANEGLLFTQFYSTGYRTEQGFLATLSATPALPVGSVIQTFGKFDKLPNLYTVFNEQGYHTSFYSGGRLFFDNIEGYLRAAGVQTMKGENEWNIHKRTVWGAYDEETFALHLNEMNQMPQPFFSAMTTMTTHEWFDADVPKIFHGDADPVSDNYRNTMHYADSCLFNYISQAKQQPWYKNTLYIIVADHSCKFPKNRNNYEKERHHIPMLMMGGALDEKWRGKQMDVIASHTDIPATLLSQLHQPHDAFKYSKNMLNPYSNKFSYYAFDNGFGMITPKGEYVYDHNQQKIIYNAVADSLFLSQIFRQGKAYLQTQFQDNLEVVSKKHE